MQILVVDDDASTRRILSRLLTDEGHAVDACADGAEALEMLGRQSYTVLVADFLMRGMNGLELIREARARDGRLHCIIISGQAKPSVEVHGGVPWITKPLDFDAVLAAIEVR